MIEYYLDKLEKQNIIAWILKNKIVNERGMPIEFDSHAFMIDPYLDWTPNQGSRKASQCGWSVMTNIKLAYAAKYGIPGYNVPAANVIYTLPSDSDVNTFVPSKTNLLIKNNPSIRAYLKGDENGKVDVDSIQRKKIGNSMVYFKGTRSKTAALMLTSDLNIHDESDRSDKNIIEEYSSRTATSMYKGNWSFSNPSVPNMPADLMYLDSDQKHWFIRCESCGHWQYLDWFKISEFEVKIGLHCYVDDKRKCYICSKCCNPINYENIKRGKWIKKYRDKSVSGYWVSHFMYSWMSVEGLLDTEAKKSKAYFMNFVRGLPYIGSDVVVDSRVIVSNIVLDDKKSFVKGKVAMGVDSGDIKHYVIGDDQGVFEIGKTKSWDDIERLINKYEPVTVIDLNPYPAKARELAAKYVPQGSHRWQVYCSYYIEESKNYELIDWGKEDKKFMVYPVRELLFDDLVAYISNGNMKFFRAKAYWEEYISHWETMYRGDFIGTRKADEIGYNTPHKQARSVWLSSTGEDHYCHATLYYYVALSRIISGRGRVLQTNATPQNIIQKDQPIRIVPNVENGMMDPVTNIIKRSITSSLGQKRGSGSVADKLR